MRVRLIKRWKFWPVGQKMEVFDTKAKQLIRDGFAERYDGELSSKEKMRTDFFKPKKNKRK